MTRWHWRIRPPNISQKAHLLLPFNSLFGCWHREDSVFPELDVCQHPHCSAIHPHPPPAPSKLSCSLCRCDVSSATESPLLRALYSSRVIHLCSFFFFIPFSLAHLVFNLAESSVEAALPFLHYYSIVFPLMKSLAVCCSVTDVLALVESPPLGLLWVLLMFAVLHCNRYSDSLSQGKHTDTHMHTQFRDAHTHTHRGESA